MDEHDVLEFVTTMCATGEARRYGEQSKESAARKFAEDISHQAGERFREGRVVLKTVKTRLKSFCTNVLKGQLDATFGDGFTDSVEANWAGIYQWTVNIFLRHEEDERSMRPYLQLRFGPSAWSANELEAGDFNKKVDRQAADYSRIFIASTKVGEVRQTSVTIHEVLDGLAPDDRRLHDALVELWRLDSD